MKKFSKSVGNRMKVMRLAQRLTQAQVAEGAGVEPSFYGQIERGVNTPSLKTFMAICIALHVNPADLLCVGLPEKNHIHDTAFGIILKGYSPEDKSRILGLLKELIKIIVRQENK